MIDAAFLVLLGNNLALMELICKGRSDRETQRLPDVGRDRGLRRQARLFEELYTVQFDGYRVTEPWLLESARVIDGGPA